MNWYKTSLFAGLLLGGFACGSDDLLVGVNGGAATGGDTQASVGGAGGNVGNGGAMVAGGATAATGAGGQSTSTSLGGSAGAVAPSLGGATVTFYNGQAQGWMNGTGWVALGALDSVTSPTCSSGAPITSAAPCRAQTLWNNPNALCVSGQIPALPPVPTASDYANNWGLQVGVNANELSIAAIGLPFSTITLYVSGMPSTGLRAVLHRKGDPGSTTYWTRFFPGSAIAATDFSTNPDLGPTLGGINLTSTDTSNIDWIAVQVTSGSTPITVTDLCLTGITFLSAAGNGGPCGNGFLDPEEQCDDGNTVSGDGCNALCQVEANWICPVPGQPCQNIAICGNGVLTSNETCDDGNTVSGDGCSADCQTIEPGWVCLAPGKPCSPGCNGGFVVSGGKCPNSVLPAVCGDGFVEAGEQCDSGSLNNDSLYGGCTTQCKLGPHCGDGIVQAPLEQCDLGGANGNMSLGANGCTAGCMNQHFCGDGIVDTNLGEQCDLGANNGQPGQPCDSSCGYILP